VNNAGGAIGTERAGDIKLEDIDYMVNTNRTYAADGNLYAQLMLTAVISLIQVTQTFLPEMKAQDSGVSTNYISQLTLSTSSTSAPSPVARPTSAARSTAPSSSESELGRTTSQLWK